MRFARFVCLLALTLACRSYAAPAEPVMLNFVNADIETVVRAIGEMTGKNFVIDPRVKGTVNIVSSRPVPGSLAYQILLSSLRLQGFAAVEGSGVVKIMPEADAKLHAKSGSPRRNDGDRLITKVFALKNGSATQLVPVIRPIVSPNNTVAAFAQGNALVVTDYADNIRRIESIIESVESASSGDVAVLPVTFGSAVEMGTMLNKLMQESVGTGGDNGKTTIIPDARANVLLVRADTPGRLGKVKSLLKVLDQPSQAGSNVRVVYLKNAEATKVAQTLRVLLNSSAGDSGGSAAATSPVNGVAASTAVPTASDSNSGNAIASTPIARNNAPAALAPAPAGSMIQADPSSNALILNVPETMYKNLRNVIDMLDRRRAQVHVEALVVELSAERAMELGVQWQTLSNGSGGATVIGGTNFPGTAGSGAILGVAGNAGNLAAQGGLNIGVVKGTVNIPGLGEILNLSVLAHALETEAQGNILSTPNLMTLDNEEAKIVVGQNVPILTGSYSTTGTGNGGSSTTPTPFQTFDRKDVGLTLKVKPQVSEGGLIKLNIFQEASSIDPTSLSNPAGITTNKRSIDTTVLVDDGSIIAIGGLIQETVSDGNNQVPLLGDIPGLGWLFKFKKQDHKKTNLMVFLKPTIVRDDIGARTLASERYDYIIGDRQTNGQAKIPLDIRGMMKAPPIASGIQQGLDAMRPAQVQPLSQPPIAP